MKLKNPNKESSNPEKLEGIYQTEIKNISKNAGISASGILVTNVLAYISTILIARVVGAEIYGIFYLANTILGIAFLFSILGLNQGVLRFVSFFSGNKNYAGIKNTIVFAVTVGLVLSLVVTSIIFLGSQLTAQLFKKPELGAALKILILALPFYAVSELLAAGLQGLRLIPQSVLVKNVGLSFLRLIFLVVFFLLGLRLTGILWASVLSFSISAVIAYALLNKHFLKSHRDLPISFKQRELTRFSSPLFFESILTQLITAMPVLMLGYFATSKDVGIFGVGLKLGLMVSVPLMAFNTIFAPTISYLYGKGEKETLARLFKTVTKWIFTGSLALFLLIVLFAEPLLSLFGRSFVEGSTALYFLVFGELINAGAGSVGYMLMMTGRPKMNLINAIILCLMTLGLGLWLIPQYGILGAALTTAVSVAIINILRLIEVYYFERIHPYNQYFTKPIVAGVCSLIFVLVFRYFIPTTNGVYTMVSILLFGLVFIATLIFLKLQQEDKYVLKLITRKVSLLF